MPKIQLSGGAYEARSVIASAQRCLNLFAEPMPQVQGEPAQFAYYPTPGLRLLGALPKGPVRAIRQCTTGGVYAVGGDTVYSVNPADWSSTALGTITGLRPYPVSMIDNGTTMVIVDGTAGGWTIDLATNAFAALSDPTGSFVGADKVDYLDTFFLFNKPNTPIFYWSLSEEAAFDTYAQDFASKSSFSDLLVTIAVAKREIWLLGERTTEIWSDVGATETTGSGTSQFQQIAGTFVDQGCRAKYSVCTYDNQVYWLSYNRAGKGIVLSGGGYSVKHVSTFALEAELTTYSRIDDAIGFVYSLGGHVMYVLTFPSADKTWAYDIITGQWHEWLWIDDNGEEHRHRLNCAYAINGAVVGGDWQNGNLYAVEMTALTDNGQPIKRQRSFPHVINNMSRVFYRQFIVDMDVGESPQVSVVETPASYTTGDTWLYSTFTAPDGTLLEDYTYPSDIGSWFWNFIGNKAVITNNTATPQVSYMEYQAQLNSPAIYPPDGGAMMTLPTANYEVTWDIVPFSYDSVPVDLVARLHARDYAAVGGGYFVEIGTGYFGSGTQEFYTYVGGLDASPSSVSPVLAMGTLSSGYYHATLWMYGTSIGARIQRSEDGLYLNSAGDWQDGQTDFFTGTDSAWPSSPTDPGGVYIEMEVSGITVGMDNVTIKEITAYVPAQPQVLAPTGTRVFLDWSNDRGHSFGNPVGHVLGPRGNYLQSVQWQRLGLARDRVFRLTWSVPVATALQGAFIEVESAKS